MVAWCMGCTEYSTEAPGFQLSSQDGKAEGRADILQNDATRVGDQAVGLSGCDYSIL